MLSQLHWQNLLEISRPYLLLCAALLTCFILTRLLIRTLARFLAHSIPGLRQDYLMVRLKKPIALLVPMLVVKGFFDGTLEKTGLFSHALDWGIITALAWLVISGIELGADLIQRKHPVESADNRHARRVRTQVTVFKRILIVLVILFALAAILLTFDSVRHLGTTLFASAGLAGLVVGMAARPLLSNLIAGVQLALTEPIRLDDVVIVEGEWGRIEEITATYVVVKIWDKRRLVLPITYFVEKPFQNWTRNSAAILGSVFVYADYSVPVAKVREELKRIAQETDLWDGEVCVLQVTEITERSVQMRALVSAVDSSTAWELRCFVREKLNDFIRENECHLPKFRAALPEKTEEVAARHQSR